MSMDYCGEHYPTELWVSAILDGEAYDLSGTRVKITEVKRCYVRIYFLTDEEVLSIVNSDNKYATYESLTQSKYIDKNRKLNNLHCNELAEFLERHKYWRLVWCTQYLEEDTRWMV